MNTCQQWGSEMWCVSVVLICSLSVVTLYTHNVDTAYIHTHTPDEMCPLPLTHSLTPRQQLLVSEGPGLEPPLMLSPTLLPLSHGWPQHVCMCVCVAKKTLFPPAASLLLLVFTSSWVALLPPTGSNWSKYLTLTMSWYFPRAYKKMTWDSSEMILWLFLNKQTNKQTAAVALSLRKVCF